MARKRGQRDASDVASSELDQLLSEPVLPDLTVDPNPLGSVFPAEVFDPLAELEDRRRWDPDPSPDPVNVRRSSARLHAPFSEYRFAEPRQVVVCARRHRRREVLFAKRRTGAGGRARRRRNAWSNYHC